ncbi:uncharacterized protein LOC126745813 [Anthonomus grandis grandis]|uniref:uncharacterized protein LOC126745813 n=1 Tax=Anthonomus grandis grandis TaxID=2921223 RepID=UPI0021657C88|nr:uncharacterized protein LOC126745813 [Anthonomus grandis grandis]
MSERENLLLNNLKKSIKETVRCSKTNIEPLMVPQDIEKLLLPLDLSKAIDTAAAQKEIKYLQEVVESLLTNDATSKYVTISQQVLLKIFAESSEKFRAKHFRELMKVYFQELLEQSDLERAQLELHIKVLLPLVKLHVLKETSEQDDELVDNILNFFKNPRISQEDIYVTVKNKFGDSDFRLISYELIPLDQRNGHLGDYFQLKVQVERNNEVQLLEMFVKFLNAKIDFFKQLLARGPSKKEEFFYLEYIPKLRELGLNELLSFAPECYFSRVDDVLVLEDMTAKGYIGLTPDCKLDLLTLKLTVSELAKLHASSFIFEQALLKKEKSFYDLYSKYLQEVFFVIDSKESKKAFQRIVKVIVYLCQVFSNISNKEEVAQKAQSLLKQAFALLPKSDEFINVLCHGDVYVANMLFNFNDKQECQDVKLIDFQILRYKPPTHDLLFFLYQNAFKETLDEHMDELLALYYEALKENLGKFHLDISKVYPKENFEGSIRPMRILAVFMSIYYSHLTTIDPKVRERVFHENQMELLRDEFYLINLGLKVEHYRKVMKGLIDSFTELCNSNDIKGTN